MADHIALGRAAIDAVRDAGQPVAVPGAGRAVGGALGGGGGLAGQLARRGHHRLLRARGRPRWPRTGRTWPRWAGRSDGRSGGVPARMPPSGTAPACPGPSWPPPSKLIDRSRLRVNRSTLQARVVVDELVRCGVTDAVLCPGSRNAPLSFALHAADAAGRLRLHVRIDERTAAFLALGLALRSGRPVPVATTSGTAVANLHPAVLEASHAGVPLLALTADRPADAIGTGANQTIVQPGIFGGAVRLDRGRAGRRGRRAGPVRGGPGGGGGDRAARRHRPGRCSSTCPSPSRWCPTATTRRRPAGAGGRPWTEVPPVARRRLRCRSTRRRRRWSLAGHHATAGARDGVPVVAEPVRRRAGRRPCGPGPGCWGGPALRPAQVVVAGRPTLHRPVQRLLGRPGRRGVRAGRPGRPSLAGRGRHGPRGRVVAGAEPRPGLAGGAGGRPTRRPAGRWTGRSTSRPRRPDCGWPGPRWPRCPTGRSSCSARRTRCATSSLAAAPRPGLTVLANRGVAGIDGTVSTAVGAALAHARARLRAARRPDAAARQHRAGASGRTSRGPT